MTIDEFYSDETFTESVGIRVVNSCYGVVNEVYGEVTPYVRREKSSCNHPSPPVFSEWYCPDYGCETINGVLYCTIGECELI